MQTAIECVSNGYTLRGMLHQPEELSDVPLVIMLHGYGATKTENKFIFVELSRELEKKGIASLRFDFFGGGESDGELQQKSFNHDLACAADILSYAQTLSFADKQRIAIVAKGTSCLIASLVATEVQDRLKALLLLSPTLSTWNEQYAAELRAAELGAAELGSAELEQHTSSILAACIISGDKESNSEVIARYQKHYQDQLALISIEDVAQVVETVTSREQVVGQSITFLQQQLL